MLSDTSGVLSALASGSASSDKKTSDDSKNTAVMAMLMQLLASPGRTQASVPSQSYNSANYGAAPAPPSASGAGGIGFSNMGGNMVLTGASGMPMDMNGKPITHFAPIHNIKDFASANADNGVVTDQSFLDSLKGALRQWSQPDTSDKTPSLSTSTAAQPAAAAQPLPTYQPQAALPNPYQPMTPPNTSAIAATNPMGLNSANWNLGGYGGSGATVGSLMPSAAYSGASAIGTGSPFSGGSFNGSPITESIGGTGGAMSGSGGLAGGAGMGSAAIGSVTSGIMGLGKGIGQMFTPGVLQPMQIVPMPQGINFGYNPMRGWG